jgi:hypothetical protein
MSLPTQITRTYINPRGNLAASGDYRASTTQELANMMPPWMHLRQNPNSVAQQLISPAAMELKRLENGINDMMRNKFINTANIGEVDVLYRMSIPSDIDLTDENSLGIRCFASTTDALPSGVNTIELLPLSGLQEFYYSAIPTRLEAVSSGNFSETVSGKSWMIAASGVLDREEKRVDIWGHKHDITWCNAGGLYRKQDKDTLEDYETYVDAPGNVSLGLGFDSGALWSVNKNGANYSMILTSTKTQMPQLATLDKLAEYELTGTFDVEPSGIIVGDDGTLYLCDTNKTRVISIVPRYDYFIADLNNRFVYFKEDYRDSGVFMMKS